MAKLELAARRRRRATLTSVPKRTRLIRDRIQHGAGGLRPTRPQPQATKRVLATRHHYPQANQTRTCKSQEIHGSSVPCTRQGPRGCVVGGSRERWALGSRAGGAGDTWARRRPRGGRKACGRRERRARALGQSRQRASSSSNLP